MKMAQPHFLQSEYPNTPAEEALFHIIPFPLERTVSYMGGTADGPRAILEASEQLETIVEGFGEPGNLGIHTHHAIGCGSDRKIAEIFNEGAHLMQQVCSAGHVPIFLGGEHSITNAAINYIVEQGLTDKVGIVQFDAHMDLRDTYEGSPYSHACVMRRAVEQGIRLHQVGIRNYSSEELAARTQFGVSHHDASQLFGRIGTTTLPKDFPSSLFITFDVDVFDASLMGATGTPEPGGLFWWDAVELLSSLCTDRTIKGADVVELAPMHQMHHCEYTVAKLTYHLMGIIARNNRFLHDRTSS
jgi:agmatinase